MLAVWMVVFVVVSILTYPPVAAFVFLTFVVTGARAKSTRRLLVGAVAFVASYGIGVLTVYALNWLAFGTFGLTISAWRRPNPLQEPRRPHRPTSARYGTQFASLVALLGWAAVVAVVCARLGRSLDSTTRRAAVIVLGAVSHRRGTRGGAHRLLRRGHRHEGIALGLVGRLSPGGLAAQRNSAVDGSPASWRCALIAVVGVVSWRTDLGRAPGDA